MLSVRRLWLWSRPTAHPSGDAMQWACARACTYTTLHGLHGCCVPVPLRVTTSDHCTTDVDCWRTSTSLALVVSCASRKRHILNHIRFTHLHARVQQISMVDAEEGLKVPRLGKGSQPFLGATVSPMCLVPRALCEESYVYRNARARLQLACRGILTN